MLNFVARSTDHRTRSISLILELSNVFYDISTMDWDYGGYPHLIGRNPFFQCFVPQEEWDTLQANIRKGPSFSEGKPETCDKHSMVFGRTFSEVGLREGDRIVAFCSEEEEDACSEFDGSILYIDSCHNGEGDGHDCETIPIGLCNPDYEKVKARIDEIIMKALQKQFAPEFINRLDEIVSFNSLSDSSIRKILDVELNQIKKRVENMGFVLEISDEAKDFLCKKGFDPQYGARPLRRAIQKYLENELSDFFINEEPKDNKIVVTASEEKLSLN